MPKISMGTELAIHAVKWSFHQKPILQGHQNNCSAGMENQKRGRYQLISMGWVFFYCIIKHLS